MRIGTRMNRAAVTEREVFTLNYDTDEALPRFAWCARLCLGSTKVHVRCGPWVERREDAFFEGAWAGPFDEVDFDTALTSGVTGARVLQAGILFSTPTHTNQPLYSIRRDGTFWISNSLCFLLAASGTSLRASYPYYEADLMTVTFGLRRYRERIPVGQNEVVRIHYYCNALVKHDLAVEVQPRRRPEPFSSYEQYVDFLKREVRETVNNAASGSRRSRLRPLATISSGYDSPACAVLAVGAGCTEAFTFVKAREGFLDRDDSGEQIGEFLGLRTTAIVVQSAKIERSSLTEAEFISSGFGGGDVTLSAAEHLLDARLLFTGTHGDKIWDTHEIPRRGLNCQRRSLRFESDRVPAASWICIVSSSFCWRDSLFKRRQYQQFRRNETLERGKRFVQSANSEAAS